MLELHIKRVKYEQKWDFGQQEVDKKDRLYRLTGEIKSRLLVKSKCRLILKEVV